MSLDRLGDLSLLPESVKRNILARLPANSNESDAPLVSISNVAAPSSKAEQQGLPLHISRGEVLLPSLKAGAAVVDGVLSQSEIQALSAAVEAWLSKHGRRPGMGSSSSGGLWHDPLYRGDINCWVTPAELTAAGQPLLAACLDMLSGLRTQLAAQGYDVGGRVSCQLACYPGKGACYVRHTDASASAPDRAVTALLYLNPDWDAQVDGGQLALYNAAVCKYSHNRSQHQCPASSCLQAPETAAEAAASSGSSSAAAECDAAAGYLEGEPALLVAPTGGRLLLFDSRLPHEVLPAHKKRLSITAWFYKGTTEHSAPAAAPGAAHVAAAHGSSSSSVPATPAAVPGRAAQAAPSSEPADPAPMPATTGVAAPSAAGTGGMPRIFVYIASFRDAECQWTLRDLFVKAAHPERVSVGVTWQIDPVADADYVRMAGGNRTVQYLPQVREVRCHYSTATGPVAARSMAQQLWQGEEYTLQIDAHMRFVQDWDILCISELHAAQQSAGHHRAVLSTYPLGYDGEGAAAAVPDAAPATLLCAKEFDESGLLRVQSRCLKQRPEAPLPSNYWAAGFSFAGSSWLLEVPYCPHLPHLFFGEEQYMLLRMWTRGWDVFAPTQPLAFHQWERTARSTSYQACGKIDAAARAASQQHVLEMVQPSDKQSVLQEPRSIKAAASILPHRNQLTAAQNWAVGGIWGLGTVRTVKQFEQQTGVSFLQRNLQARALYGGHTYKLLFGSHEVLFDDVMEFGGEEFGLLPATTGIPPARDKIKIKDSKVWLAGELIIRCERQGLETLPQQLFLKTTVRKLVLTGNQLDSLPVKLFQQLRELRELRVGYNKITYLPEEVQQLQHLEVLDLQHNQLKLVPASLYRCVHLQLLNLSGNPLCSWLKELWPELTSAAVTEPGSSSGGGGDQAGSRGCSAAEGRESAAGLQQLKADTKALLAHLLQEQDPAIQRQVQQAQLAVCQVATRARLGKMLKVVDPDSLEECHRLATLAQLDQQMLGQVQQLQAGAESLQAALVAVQQCQRQQLDGDAAVLADLQAELSASLRRVEGLCKPGRPAGPLYECADSLRRMLQRQQLQRGWRCAPPANAAVGLVSEGAAALAVVEAAGGSQGSSSPRRFLTSAERVRRQLAVNGAKTYKEWAALKQQQEERQKQKLKALPQSPQKLAKAEAEGHVKVVAERAAKAVADCGRERQWPSKRVEAFPHGTFSLSPEVLKAVRKAYYTTPPLEEQQNPVEQEAL